MPPDPVDLDDEDEDDRISDGDDPADGMEIDDVLDSPLATDRELLRAKLKRDAGRGDITAYDAIRARLQLEMALGNLLKTEDAAAVFTEYLLRYTALFESIPDDVLRELSGTAFDMQTRTAIRNAVVKAVAAVRARVASEGGPETMETDLRNAAQASQVKRRTSRAVGKGERAAGNTR